MTQLSESQISPQVVQVLEAEGCQLWRNNVGAFKRRGCWISFGIGGKGGADYLGYKPVRITQEMVGSIVAVFVAAEVKKPTGKIAPEQVTFIRNAQAAGAIAGFCHSWEQGRELVKAWFARFKP